MWCDNFFYPPTGLNKAPSEISEDDQAKANQRARATEEYLFSVQEEGKMIFFLLEDRYIVLIDNNSNHNQNRQPVCNS